MRQSPYLTQGQIPNHCERRPTPVHTLCGDPVVGVVEALAGIADKGDRRMLLKSFVCRRCAYKAIQAIRFSGRGIYTPIETFQAYNG